MNRPTRFDQFFAEIADAFPVGTPFLVTDAAKVLCEKYGFPLNTSLPYASATLHHALTVLPDCPEGIQLRAPQGRGQPYTFTPAINLAV